MLFGPLRICPASMGGFGGRSAESSADAPHRTGGLWVAVLAQRSTPPKDIEWEGLWAVNQSPVTPGGNGIVRRAT